jgi:hypothetical protein
MRRFLFLSHAQDFASIADRERLTVFNRRSVKRPSVKTPDALTTTNLAKIFSRFGFIRTSAQRVSSRYHLHGINKTVRIAGSKTCRFLRVPQVLKIGEGPCLSLLVGCWFSAL